MAGPRTVFVLKIDKGCDSQGLFEPMYGGLLVKLKNVPSLSVSTIDTVNDFQAKIAGCSPKESVLLCTNEFIANKKNLHEMVKQFTIGGGLLIFGCHFSSFTRPLDIDALFKSLGLPWKNSDYNRTTFGITETGRFLLQGLGFEETYSAKALQLSHVLPEQKLYKPVENASTQSMVFAPSAANPSSTMAAFGKIGSGAVAYVGDVNAETGSDRLIVALCLAKW